MQLFKNVWNWLKIIFKRTYRKILMSFYLWGWKQLTFELMSDPTPSLQLTKHTLKNLPWKEELTRASGSTFMKYKLVLRRFLLTWKFHYLFKYATTFILNRQK